MVTQLGMGVAGQAREPPEVSAVREASGTVVAEPVSPPGAQLAPRLGLTADSS